MKQFTTIIHPIANQPQEKEKKEHYRFKNFELQTEGLSIASNERGTIHGVLLGYLTNGPLLKKELSELGLTFSTSADSEVILQAYVAWQEEFLKKLSGPFSLILFDNENQILLAARDPLGQKSLYWSAQKESAVISTSLKALLATKLVAQTPAIDALSTYLYFGYIPQDLAPIQGVSKLLPGHYLKGDLGQRLYVKQYWSLSEKYEHQITHRNTPLEQLKQLLEQSINQQGTLISTDSIGSALLSLLLPKKFEREPLHFQSAEVLFDTLVESVWQLEEPIANPTAYALQPFAKKASSKGTHTLITDCGHCEFAASRERYFFKPKENSRFLNFLERSLPRSFLSFFGNEIKYKILRQKGLDRDLLNYLNNLALFSAKESVELSKEFLTYFNAEIFIQRFHKLSNIPGQIDPLLYFDTKTCLTDSELLSYDKLLAAYNIEIAHPYLNLSIVDFFARTPSSIKCHGMQKNPETAALLKRLYFQLTGQQIVQTFDQPFFQEKDQAFFQKEFSLLGQSKLLEEGYFNTNWLKQKLSKKIDYRTFHQLFALYILEIWFRLFIDTPIEKKSESWKTREFLK